MQILTTSRDATSFKLLVRKAYVIDERTEAPSGSEISRSYSSAAARTDLSTACKSLTLSASRSLPNGKLACCCIAFRRTCERATETTSRAMPSQQADQRICE